MKIFIAYQKVKYKPNEEVTVTLPEDYISHIDLSLTARIKSSYNSKPQRALIDDNGALESIPQARKTAFWQLLRNIAIQREGQILFNSNGIQIVYSNIFLTQKPKLDSLPMWGHTKKIKGKVIIHPGFDTLGKYQTYQYDSSRAFPAKDANFIVDWADEKALGQNYKVQWAKLELKIYGYKEINQC